ncbi:prepilin peptidase [Sporomusa malonica]|uniref:Prepilin leader peptidase/N-methyltransferase n=1 Tax=Sporomusa malonica TaxID=112901 RepID=A0A1W2EAI6_9FIRM|nr:leader peptidase (prepilin peptidase) / N-methyltransferase [Sporomusa malonica]
MIEMSLLLVVLGLIVGSFINVCIFRLPRNESIVFPGSRCVMCKTPLKSKDLIPVIGYFLLLGRCRYCECHISIRYPVVELFTAFIFLYSFFVVGSSVKLIEVLIFISFLIMISIIDYDHQLILDKTVVLFSAVGVIFNIFINGSVSVLDMFLGSLLGGAILLLIAIITKGGMGGGDIKFVAALGLWLGLKLTLLTIFLSFIIGGIGSLLLLAFKIKSRKDFIPFGPFISIAAFISMLYGTEIISWYLQTIVK